MNTLIDSKDIKEIVVVCEAGVGSSLMTVNAMKKKMKAVNLPDIKIYHKRLLILTLKPLHHLP